MSVRNVVIAMNGVTGRMGTNQHLIRSIMAIRAQGGIVGRDGVVIMPEPILLGRNAEKLKALADRVGAERWSTDVDATIAQPDVEIYFDATLTDQRGIGVRKAIAAGKHVYCEKPTATSTAEAMALYEEAARAGVKHGVVQDKLWLPGIVKLKRLIDDGFFGRILSIRGEFGYWVFTGEDGIPQRPSWNYRAEEGGGIIFDMLCHWRYVLDQVFGGVRAVSCLGATHIPRRHDESANWYEATADDAAYATFELDGGIVAQFNSSWCVRVRRDDLLTIQVDGTNGSAVAGLRECRIQASSQTPRPVWNPDIPSPIDFFGGWEIAPGPEEFDNAFKAQWELFLQHVVDDEPFPWDLREGAKGVQLAELGIESWRSRSWIDVPALAEARA